MRTKNQLQIIERRAPFERRPVATQWRGTVRYLQKFIGGEHLAQMRKLTTTRLNEKKRSSSVVKSLSLADKLQDAYDMGLWPIKGWQMLEASWHMLDDMYCCLFLKFQLFNLIPSWINKGSTNLHVSS